MNTQYKLRQNCENFIKITLKCINVSIVLKYEYYEHMSSSHYRDKLFIHKIKYYVFRISRL